MTASGTKRTCFADEVTVKDRLNVHSATELASPLCVNSGHEDINEPRWICEHP